METLGEKYGKLSNQKQQEEAEQERIKKIEEAKLAPQKALERAQKDKQEAQKIIDNIPKIIEKAVSEGKRNALIDLGYIDSGEYRDSTFLRLTSRKFIGPASTVSKLVLEYCAKQGLHPKFITGRITTAFSSNAQIEIRW
jgi:hypothetical protein